MLVCCWKSLLFLVGFLPDLGTWSQKVAPIQPQDHCWDRPLRFGDKAWLQSRFQFIQKSLDSVEVRALVNMCTCFLYFTSLTMKLLKNPSGYCFHGDKEQCLCAFRVFFFFDKCRETGFELVLCVEACWNRKGRSQTGYDSVGNKLKFSNSNN